MTQTSYEMMHNDMTQTSDDTQQYDITTLLPSVSAVVLGMFCGAKYTHHMPVIKHH